MDATFKIECPAVSHSLHFGELLVCFNHHLLQIEAYPIRPDMCFNL